MLDDRIAVTDFNRRKKFAYREFRDPTPGATIAGHRYRVNR
jgi:hypothetical protein